ncbi:MAG: SDR family oxidoreductase [Flavobacteriaceae bacterium]|nr:SDR family oxidoreductase [Bacteroidia bacterium]NNF73597.1 SDR family oxidoreductase [Flavobacteriaceae bacterium]
MDLNLKDKRALVCGSTQGIGRATAILLAGEGARITLMARNEDKLKAVLKELPGDSDHDYLIGDFFQPDNLRQTVARYLKSNPGFHILINNTGGPRSGLIIDASADEFLSAFNQHLICNHELTKLTVPFMKEKGYGRIINVISTSVKEPIPGLGVSNTIRNAVANWSKTLAGELGGHGITVNNVLPGFTQTERLNEIIRIKAQREERTEAEMAEIMKNYTPARRFAHPEETAQAIAFLSSDKASYINGINLPVDGGRTKSL